MITITKQDGKYTAVKTLPLPGGRELRMTYDVSPLPGKLVLDLGHGLTVVEREAPRPGGAWVAPYAANCAEHGHVDCRATVGQARDEARAHIAAEHRTLDAGRREQGFTSQAHLDAHFAYSDHQQDCAECQRPGPAMWLEGSASWQPTQNVCAEGRRLLAVSDSFSQYAREGQER